MENHVGTTGEYGVINTSSKCAKGCIGIVEVWSEQSRASQDISQQHLQKGSDVFCTTPVYHLCWYYMLRCQSGVWKWTHDHQPAYENASYFSNVALNTNVPPWTKLEFERRASSEVVTSHSYHTAHLQLVYTNLRSPFLIQVLTQHVFNADLGIEWTNQETLL